MQFIKQFKKLYYQKLIDDHFANQKFKELKTYFNQLKTDQVFDQIQYFIDRYIDENEARILFENKIGWINSFDIEDTKYLSQFIDFYFSKLNLSFNSPKNYLSELASTCNIFLDSKKILSFDDLTSISYALQYLITLQSNKKINFLCSQSAFYVSNKNFFTHHHLSTNYIYIVRNPISIFNKYHQAIGDVQQAMTNLFNFENKLIQKKFVKPNKELMIEENRQSWSINANSWMGNNTKNTYRGLILKIEDLYLSPEEKLAEIISHLSLSYPECKLDYRFIEEYIEKIPLPPLDLPHSISNQQKKIIRREIEQYDQLIELEYDI